MDAESAAAMALAAGMLRMFFILAGTWGALSCFVCTSLGFSQGDKKGAPLWGGFLGFLFGPIGVIIVCLADFGPPSPVRKVHSPPVEEKPYRGKSETLPSGDVPDEWLR